MATPMITSIIRFTRQASTSESSSPYPSTHSKPGFQTRPTPPKLNLSTKTHSLAPAASLSDPIVLQIAETLEDSLSPLSTTTPPALQKLRDASAESLLSTPWPTRKDEPFRFTDTSFIKLSHIKPVPSPPQTLNPLAFSTDTQLPNLVFIDGFLVDSLSQLPPLPDGVFVGSLSRLNSEAVMERVSEFVLDFQGDLFWSINGVGAPDLVVVYVPEGCRIESPLHFRYCSAEGADSGLNVLPVSNPRVLVVVEKGGEVGIVEEYVGQGGDKCYWANSVTEVVVGEGVKVSHSYIHTQSLNAAHIHFFGYSIKN